MSRATTPMGLTWIKATRSVGQGACVAIAKDPGGGYFLRNTNRPEQGYLSVTQAEIDAFIGGAKEGDFDQFVTAS